MIPLALSIDGGDVLAAVAVIIGAYLALRGVRASAAAQRDTALIQAAATNNATKAAEATAAGGQSEAFTRSLLTRLQAVEDRVSELETALSKSQRALQAAIRFIDRLVDWGRDGGKGPTPRPPRTLHEYLDADTWGSDETPTADELEPTTGGVGAAS